MAPKVGTGRGRGFPNYQKDILLNIISDLLPTGALAWQRVAERYRAGSGENSDREPADLKRFFVQKVCNNNKKPTGEASGDIKRAQDIRRRILVKENAVYFSYFCFLFIFI